LYQRISVIFKKCVTFLFYLYIITSSGLLFSRKETDQFARMQANLAKFALNIENTLNKVTLKYELDLDFVLIAITSSLRDYRLCYFINKVTRLKLGKVEDHEIWMPMPLGKAFFSCYADFSTTSDTEFYLLANRGTDGRLLVPEMRGSDYFMLIRNFIDDEDLIALQEDIGGIAEVVVASEISPQKLKSKENLIF